MPDPSPRFCRTYRRNPALYHNHVGAGLANYSLADLTQTTQAIVALRTWARRWQGATMRPDTGATCAASRVVRALLLLDILLWLRCEALSQISAGM